MHDRVADVLAQRASLDSSAGVAVVVSLLLHGGAAAFAIWSAMHQPPPQQASMVSIRLAPASRPIAPMTPRVAKPATPKPPRIEEPKPVAPPKAEPAPVTTTTPPPKNAVPTSAFGRSTKPGADVPVPPPAPAPAPAATSTAPAIAVGGSGVTGIEGGDFPYTLYIERMQTLIGQKWFRPQVVEGTETTVYFRIQRDGTIRDAKTETTSNNGTFDRAALRAVLEASPLPPLPFAYNGNYLGVHLKFR